MPIHVRIEPKAYRTLPPERCVFCSEDTRYWYGKGAHPVCRGCAKTHKVSDLRALTPVPYKMREVLLDAHKLMSEIVADVEAGRGTHAVLCGDYYERMCDLLVHWPRDCQVDLPDTGPIPSP